MERSHAAWMSELLGRKVSPQRGWEYLRGLAMRPLVPRPHHQETSWEEQEAWKKKLASETQRIQVEHPDANVEVWTMDEHRLGLKPVLPLFCHFPSIISKEIKIKNSVSKA